jgi:ribose 5-phosphate isomerase B
MIVAIGSDHAGFELKEVIKQSLGYSFVDKGCYSKERVDYADFGHAVSTALLSKEADFGILLCGSGNGIGMAANKHKGIRAAICWNKEVAALARQHNNANILVLPARFIDNELAIEMVQLFVNEQFEAGRHLERIKKIDLGI